MARPLRIEYPDAWYHVMNRGRRGEAIFADGSDYTMFTELLQETSEMWNIQIAAYCLMPNHVHVLFDTSIQVSEEMYWKENWEGYVQLNKIMQLIKGGSSKKVNDALGRKGTFWYKDSYDHFIRNEKEWSNIFIYILENPVKAKLVKKWNDWNFTYVNPLYLGD